MLKPKALEERNLDLALRLSESMPICVSQKRYGQLIDITSNMVTKTASVILELEKLLKEPEPDYDGIRCVIDSDIVALDALEHMEFKDIVSPVNIASGTFWNFLQLRINLIYSIRGKFQLLRNEIPIYEKNDCIVKRYRTERLGAINPQTDICLIFDRSIPEAKRAIDHILCNSPLSFFVKNVMAEPFCCPNNNLDDTSTHYLYDIYTIAIISFWNPIKKDDIFSIFPEAYFPESENLIEYYNKYFLFESLFRDTPSYHDIQPCD